MFEVLMHVVGYSSFAQNTLESNAILCVKIFGGKHRSRSMHKEGEIRLALLLQR